MIKKHPFLSILCMLISYFIYVIATAQPYKLYNTANGAPNAIGNIKGVKFSIPYDYMNYGITYEGENWLDSKTKIKNPNFDTPIQSLSMAVRLKDFMPIRKNQEIFNQYNASLDFKSKHFPPDYFEDSSKWIEFSLHVQNNLPKNMGSILIDRYIDKTKDDKNLYYEEDKEKPYGLTHLIPKLKDEKDKKY